MATPAKSYDLRPDEFAVVFDSDRGVEVNELGIFFQRLATVARGAGAELHVLAHEPGSLAVIVRAIARSATGEFRKAPVATTAAGLAIVGAVTAAVLAAMSPGSGRVTPLAKIGAHLVENHDLNNIQIVTINQTFVVMDEKRVTQIRALEGRRTAVREAYNLPSTQGAPEIRQLVTRARQGQLSGSIHVAAGALHFRPDGYHYMVPIDKRKSSATGILIPEQRYRVTGELLTLGGQPDRIIIRQAVAVQP